jgi:hypothetical protein
MCVPVDCVCVFRECDLGIGIYIYTYNYIYIYICDMHGTLDAMPGSSPNSIRATCKMGALVA